MSFSVTCLLKKQNRLLTAISVRHRSQRRNLGKPPGIAKTLEERMEEMNFKDPKIHFKVDIGLPTPQRDKKMETAKRIEFIKKIKCNAELEKLSRNNELPVSLDEISNDWSKTNAPLHIKKVAEYYGIFEHLFGDAYFTPYVQMDISYDYNSKKVPVYRGNIIKPNEALYSPKVNFEAPEKTLWTLMLTNPDGHLHKENSEYIHWLVGNIPGGDVNRGETVFNYLQPFPAKGTGYQRMIFVLYKQSSEIDFSSIKSVSEKIDLANRTFSTFDFYCSHEDIMTPAGLAFYQTDWDNSLTKFYHDQLSMPEPVYEYDFQPPYIKPQKWFPLKEPFNLYMDKYRDEKQIAKEFLMRKLRKTHPFQKPEPPLKYPNAVPFKKTTPSWLKLEMKKERLRWGRVNDY
ncbi:39S ribosomal protein L38, mitochondrial [Acyrthosiphon pisum]|uniref:Large ribosomal subunit protein mL38 n=1 Tax=Acyrthosiphon pisum TaxID=7029 RepID=A0A8R2B8E2_ACYPI|nr:39S ribosomal protein L38, mitochondrial [Acyrthosiphon pisum]|eukprot:XP_008186104.1 PREDICTED: 39S ribosomal protein L38, mitochondrial [Acyrthosiphon pisum]